jgi:putative ABC transport system ATP-binding protein
MTTVMRLDGIRRYYRTGPTVLHVLAGLDLTVQEGEWVAILGASGSGKSTLLNIVGLLDRPDGGTYHLRGTEVSTLDDRARTRVRNRELGFVFQRFNLLPRTTAVDNVATPLLYDRVPRRRRQELALQALARVGLADWAHHDPSELSGGQMQRVAIARALVIDPAVLLADEPTGNLDRESGEDVMRLFTALHRSGRTIVMITHDHDVAAEADRQVILRDGRLHASEATPRRSPAST